MALIKLQVDSVESQKIIHLASAVWYMASGQATNGVRKKGSPKAFNWTKTHGICTNEWDICAW